MANQKQYSILPVTYQELENACAFSTNQCYEGIAGITGKELRIFKVERLLGETFTQTVLRTKYTPTRLQVNPKTGHLIVVERDYNCYTET